MLLIPRNHCVLNRHFNLIYLFLFFYLWQMILVAVFAKTGFFDYLALKVRRKQKYQSV